MATYTINMIQEEMTAAGSHWWDRGSMRFFRCRVGGKVYQGEGGLFFVSSEKHNGDPRQYTVRQYHPDTKLIGTIGDFNSLSRSQAHRQAAKLAGPQSVVVSEANKPVSDAEQLVIDIDRNGGHCSGIQAALLIRLASHHHAFMEGACNGLSGVFDDEGDPLPPLTGLRTNMRGVIADCGLPGAIFSGDPRGCTVKLEMPNGATNDFGGEGWCIPTR